MKPNAARTLRSTETFSDRNRNTLPMDPEQLLQSLGLSLNEPNLRFDANGCARLAIDGAPALDFERGGNGILHVYSVLGPLPPEGREVLFTELLKGNLFGSSTAGAS